MDTIKYIIKRLLLSVLILFGVSVIIYALARMMPTDYVDNQYASALQQGTMRQEDVDRIKELYGLSMPDAFLFAKFSEGSAYNGVTFTKNTKEETYTDVLATSQNEASEEERKVELWSDLYAGSYDAEDGTRLYLNENGTWSIYSVETGGVTVEGGEEADDGVITVQEQLSLKEEGTYTVSADGSLTLTVETDGKSAAAVAGITFAKATFWQKAGSLLGGYFTWLNNMLHGDLGMSFKYKQPVEDVIAKNMGISFAIAFIATILQFVIAIFLGIKAAVKQYGFVDYSVTVLSMMGISLPTFFLSALVIRIFSMELGWFEVGGLHSGQLPMDATAFETFLDMAWHMVLPMLVLVILSVGSLMRHVRTNTLEVLNADYIRTARAKGLSERTVIYKHAFRNTMIPLVTMMAGILPSLFGGAMITETVFSIPGIGKLAYDALIVADIPFIMGYNMFLAVMTVLGTLLSDLMYAVVDPRVKIGK